MRCIFGIERVRNQSHASSSAIAPMRTAVATYIPPTAHAAKNATNGKNSMSDCMAW